MLTFLVTGGAGFIGCNLAHRLASDGHQVRIYDNLSRAGVRENLTWLASCYPDRIQLYEACITNRPRLRQAVTGVAGVFHLAAQVAVTTSLNRPFLDFDTNLRGTLELLEALRALPEPPPLVYTSTNKVYGCLPDIELRESDRRWEPVDAVLARRGVGETRSLEFRSPYGCSKGAADQYVLDYAKTFGLPATVFRMSCIYGPHQLGSEAQGWVAHFLIRTLHDQPITIYGDGKQVRDVLYVDDLVDALVRAWCDIDRLTGRPFNMGGGPPHTLSLLELLEAIEALHGRRPAITQAEWRPGDQRYYVSDLRDFHAQTGWRPRIGVRQGIARLYRWLAERRRASGDDVTSPQASAGLHPAGGTING